MESVASPSSLQHQRAIPVKIELRAVFFEGQKWGRKVFFNISKLEIETQWGQMFHIGSRYRLVGSVGGIFDFDVERRVGRDRHLDIYVPLERQASFNRDEFYEVRIRSIRCVEEGDERIKPGELHVEGHVADGKRANSPAAVWTIDENRLIPQHLLKAQRRNGGKAISFVLNKAWIEKQTGLNFETGKSYRISGSIGGVCKFSSILRETGYSDTHHVYASTEGLPRLAPGLRYDVRVEIIVEIPKTYSHAGQADSFWEWKTVTAWTDTEGQYQGRKPPFKAVISQDEREPLDGIHYFLSQEGISSIVYNVGNGHFQLRTLGGMEALAKFVLHTEPYVRTQNKLNQIKQFKEWLLTRSRREGVHKRNARRILGI